MSPSTQGRMKMPTNLLSDALTHRIPLTFPRTLELKVLFREFMAYWSRLGTDISDRVPVLPALKPVEFIVRWNGSVKGALTIRCSNRLLDKLMEGFQDRDKDFPNKAALFGEMASLFSLFLIQSIWMDDAFSLGPILARPCEPKDRPPMAESHAFCAVTVDSEPVEIRLWLDPAGAHNPILAVRNLGS